MEVFAQSLRQYRTHSMQGLLNFHPLPALVLLHLHLKSSLSQPTKCKCPEHTKERIMWNSIGLVRTGPHE